jgi:hypothetical protein
MTTPTQQDANDVLFGGAGAPALSWQNPQTNQDYPVGTSYEGPIVKLDSTQQRNIQDKAKLDYWPDGRPKMVALVTIQTNQRDPNVTEDDGQRTLWVSGKYLTNAVKDAVRKAGAQRLDIGGHLKVTLAGYGQPQPGFRAPRLFEVVYTKPQPGAVGANDALGMAQPAVQPAFSPPQPQPTPPVGQPAFAPPQAQQPAPAAAPAGQMDLSSLPPDARALVEKMYAQQQGGAQ